MGAAFLQSDPGGFALGDFWSLTQQAGPLRWPIFFVLAFGLVQVFVKLYELIRDRRVSQPLYAVDYAQASLADLTTLVSRQEASMLSSLQSTMLNVFHTRPGEGLLHDEISNFVAFQQDQFSVFRRRMEFLSDTAGALGLMGTVWGMFTVFFQGTAQQDVILRGMGIALITTLLGLVVSIILNFAATELTSFFNKRLEQVSTKSDELRFRLMELAPKSVPVAAAPVEPGGNTATRGSQAGPPPPPAPAITGPGAAATGPRRVSTDADGSTGGKPDTGAPASKVVEDPAKTRGWCWIEVAGDLPVVAAGETASDVTLVVRNGDGGPAADRPVLVALPAAGGALEGGARQLRTRSDPKGLVKVSFTAPEAVGPFGLDVSLPDQPGPATRVDVKVRPGSPHRVDIEGNNQAAVAGMKLPAPLGVRVFDRFDNPVPGVPIGFAVTQGAGKLASGKSECRVQTDASGLARTPFVVASDAGQNVVAATIDGTKREIEFVAFGTEV